MKPTNSSWIGNIRVVERLINKFNSTILIRTPNMKAVTPAERFFATRIPFEKKTGSTTGAFVGV